MDLPTGIGPGVDALLRRFPLGARIRGRVRAHPAPGIGVFVDLAPEGPAPRARGFVDAEHLRGRDRWPPAGTVTDFEVLRHDVRRAAGTLQIRLWPLDSALRHPRAAPHRRRAAAAGAHRVLPGHRAAGHHPPGPAGAADRPCRGLRGSQT
ncbi:hypothetical protein ACFVXG_25070 [Kitasatospora sp. NPDC058162]|uniref:hypothetical protein n=1 Tax=Kitasatospora sp. NPDC058162 TaxID=3346362 RepID=UPI0036D8CB2C